MRTFARLFALSCLVALPAAGQAPPPDPRFARADSLFMAGAFRAAADAYASAVKPGSFDNRSRYRYAMSLANSGNPQAAAPILDSAAANGNPVVLYNAGSVHARLGHVDTAFAYLNMSIARGFSNLQILAADSGFMKVRNDSRYGAAETRLRDAFTPCVSNADSHKFDFWVGEWTVVSPAGQVAGSSSVQKILSDCVVLENWTDGQGGQGKSYNAFNKPLGQWQQFYVDQYGNVTEYRESEWVGASLQFTAKSTNPQGVAQVQRMTFTPIDANTVRQFGQTSTDGGKTWTTAFDLTYRRK